MSKKIESIKNKWRSVKKSSRFHNALIFLIFVIIATIFWFILALNDSVSETFHVKMTLENVPDSVTFINDPPGEIHVTVRDKGTNLLRSGIMKQPSVRFNFRDYSDQGVFRLSRNDINSALKSTFGNSVQIMSTSLDSLRLSYTVGRGKRVPVLVEADVTAASGYIIASLPESVQHGVMIFSVGNETDTINRVYTQRVTRHNLSQTTYVDVALRPIPRVKAKPSKVRVKIPVEPLVKKEGMAVIETVNVPEGINLLLFPNTVPVSCYVPMSQFSDKDLPIKVFVDYNETLQHNGNRLAVHPGSYPSYAMNVELGKDSVEYTLMKQ